MNLQNNTIYVHLMSMHKDSIYFSELYIYILYVILIPDLIPDTLEWVNMVAIRIGMGLERKTIINKSKMRTLHSLMMIMYHE